MKVVIKTRCVACKHKDTHKKYPNKLGYFCTRCHSPSVVIAINGKAKK